MRRRTVIAGLAALIMIPKRSLGQQPQPKIPRIGILSAAEIERTPNVEALREGLHDLGYVEGGNIILEVRLAHGDVSLFPQLARELVALHVAVIVADGGASLIAKVSGQVPVVLPTWFDPVGQGLASSLSRPGGYLTGFTLMSAELDTKRLELLRTAFPQITTISVLVNPSNPALPLMLERIELAAKSMGLGTISRVEAPTVEVLRALRPAVFSGASAVLVVGSNLFWHYRRDVVALVNEARLPAIYPEREYVDDVGLMVYGANVVDNFRRAAAYVDRILKGAKPGDLPIQEPVRFDFVVNLKTAKELGLTVPPSILARADEVIE